MAQVEAVCHSGAVMPAKSTFFYPKTLAGLLFTSLEDGANGSAFERYLQGATAEVEK